MAFVFFLTSGKLLAGELLAVASRQDSRRRRRTRARG
jgi:hypothetical protein